MQTDSSIKASVIVPTVGRRQVLLNTLESLLQEGCHGCRCEFEVLVVEQPPYMFSPDDIHGWKQSRPHCRWIRLEKANLPQARNIGILNSNGEVIIFVDDDMRFGSGFIQAHIDAHASVNVGAVAGRLINEKVLGLWEAYWLRRHPFFSPISATLYGGFDLNGESRPVTTAPGGNMSVSRQVIHQTGGFDPTFEGVALREEADALERLKRLGYQIIYEPRALAWHLRAPTGGERRLDPSTVLYWSRRNESFFISKNFSVWPWYGFVVRSSLAAILQGFRHFTVCHSLKTSLRATIAGRQLSLHTSFSVNFLSDATKQETFHEIP